MSDVVYEETATMIAAGELQSFVPFGRDHCRNHPNAFNLQLRELQPASELWSSDCAAGLAGSLQEVSLQEREKESWQLRKGCVQAQEQDVDFEEELYTARNVVVWTQGSRAQSSNVYKAFTVDSPVEQALWCDFAVPQGKTDDEKVEHTVCIVQNGCVNIHTVTGKDFLSPLPFQVSKVWPTKFGLLLERKITATDGQLGPQGESLPTVFSMLHPIDEVAPVVCKPSGPLESSRVEYMSDPGTRIVFTCCQPSVVVSYDSVQGTHSVWSLRKVTREERSTVLSCLSKPFGEPLGFLATGFLMSHLRNHSRLDSPRFNSGLGGSGAAATNSPLHYSTLHSHQNRILMSSPAGHSRVHSPGISKMAALSRDHSPGMAAPSLSGVARFNTTIHALSPMGLHHGALNSPNSTVNESVVVPELEPIIPDLFMEQLWSETATCHSLGRELSSQASKVFLTSDLCENRYLCFLVESHQQLRCVKFMESNDTSQLIFATVTCIAAKDAEPLQNINAMLVLEACGSLVLYTGITRVSKVFVPGLLPSGFSLNNHRVGLYSLEKVSTPASANSRHVQRLDEAAMPSPVSELSVPTMKHHEGSFLEDYLFQQAMPYIHALRDPVSNRVTLELSNGTMLRISIPDIATSELVRKCLQAIRFILPKEAAMKVLVKWYTIYNAPGGTSPHGEWNLFVTCFLTLMGYNTERLTWMQNLHFEVPLSPVIAAKKARPCDGGSDEDWDYLLGCHYHRQMDGVGRPADVSGFGASVSPVAADSSSSLLGSSSPPTLDNTAALFAYIPALFYVLHLLYQELLLSELHRERASSLVCLLQQLARDLQLDDYVDLYWRDYPSLMSGFPESCLLDQSLMEQMQHPSFLRAEPPCIFSWLSCCLRGEEVPPFPYLPGICHRIRLLVLSYALYISGDDNATTSNVSKYLVKLSAGQKSTEPQCRRQSSVNQVASCSQTLAEQLVVWLTSQGFTLKDLESVPFGAALPIRDAIYHCREQPCADWSEEVCLLIGRQDRTRQAHKMTLAKSKASVGSSLSLDPPTATEADEEEDGMSDIIQEVTGLIWSQDLRIQEVRRLLQSSKPVRVSVVQLPEVSDHEYIEEKENKLLQLCQRTMSLPVGRGLFTLFSYQPVPTELLPIPKLNLTGRAPPRNTMVDLNSGNIDVPANMTSWPSFHNGVAAGLKIAPASQVDSAWIIYNKNKNQEMANEHAGFLMALGLNGHLTKLGTLNIHDYLNKGHEMTSIGLLLGVAAARLGTMDVSTTRLLSIHIPALLPPTSTELDVPHNIQVASVIGIGLVYQGTGHRHIAEVLQSEIGRPPGPEMECCTDRESYSLAAGLALGMVCLGQGSNLIGMSDLNVPEQLYQYMVGGHRRAPVGAGRERHKSPSYQIKEGDTINVDVTFPGATLALAMIYLKTNNRSIADWLKPPDTWFLLDFIKPEFLLLRTLARCIIMWDEILPNSEWVKSNVPQIMRGTHLDSPENINMETWIQVQDYITAGACMALGLRFAGSANSDAFECLYDFAKSFMKVMSFYGTSAVEPGCYNMQTALSMILLSMSMVMSGTGNLKVLQLCRFLHYRTGGEMNYGFHMAHHMALGILFLGGGRFSLSTSNSAIAALLCALYPHFPSHSTDNRYHLQALRHLTVLAAETRLLVPVDVDSLKPCYALLEVTYKKTEWYDETTVELMAPTMLPELHLLKRVRVKGPRYWELSIDLIKEVQHLKSILSRDGVLYVKLRAGQLPYKDDPQGWKSLLASAVNQRSSGVGAFKLEAISTFTSEPALLSFAEFFCKTSDGMKHREETVALFSAMLYECVTQECPEMLPTYVAIEQAVGALCRGELRHSFALWQMRLVVELWDSRVLRRPSNCRDALLSSEFLPVMKNKVDVALDQWLKDNSSALRSYVGGEPPNVSARSPMLACFLVYRSVPCLRNKLAQLRGCTSLRDLLTSSRRLGIPLRDLLRLAPVLLEAAGEPRTPPGFLTPAR